MRKTPRSIKKLIRRIKYWQEKLKTALAPKPPKGRRRIRKRRKTKPRELQLAEIMGQKPQKKTQKN